MLRSISSSDVTLTTSLYCNRLCLSDRGPMTEHPVARTAKNSAPATQRIGRAREARREGLDESVNGSSIRRITLATPDCDHVTALTGGSVSARVALG
jgi:hypothetical protein